MFDQADEKSFDGLMKWVDFALLENVNEVSTNLSSTMSPRKKKDRHSAPIKKFYGESEKPPILYFVGNKSDVKKSFEWQTNLYDILQKFSQRFDSILFNEASARTGSSVHDIF
jgi:hypothetical protein